MGSSNNNGPKKPLRQYAYEPHENPPQQKQFNTPPPPKVTIQWVVSIHMPLQGGHAQAGLMMVAHNYKLD